MGCCISTLWIALGLLAAGPGACAPDARDEARRPPVTEPEKPATSIETVLAERTPEWMDVPGVVGTGIGLCDGDRCIVVYVSERTPEVERRIPAEVEGHRVRIEVTGPIRARDPDGGT
ncbi:MAG: hypothetical protein ACREMK_15140 [Gemmatimonadota bacterium]